MKKTTHRKFLKIKIKKNNIELNVVILIIFIYLLPFKLNVLYLYGIILVKLR